MIEVAPGLFVGNAIDYERNVKGKSGWAVLHCAKEPYHREAVGYSGRGLADRDHPEYLVARRGDRMMLNMVDAPKPEFFNDDMIDAGVAFIVEQLASGKLVLVHCNQGGSRAPSMALYYLRRHSDAYADMTFKEAEDVFQACYPPYMPAKGIQGYVEKNWDRIDAGQGQSRSAIAGP